MFQHDQYDFRIYNSFSKLVFVCFFHPGNDCYLQHPAEVCLGQCSSLGRWRRYNNQAQRGSSKLRLSNPILFFVKYYKNLILKATPPGSKIYTMRGYDQDGDHLVFGIQKTRDSDLIKVTNLNNDQNEAVVTLEQELDAETRY